MPTERRRSGWGFIAAVVAITAAWLAFAIGKALGL